MEVGTGGVVVGCEGGLVAHAVCQCVVCVVFVFFFLFLMQVEMATSSESGATVVCLLGKTTIACTAILYMRNDEVVNEEGDR